MSNNQKISDKMNETIAFFLSAFDNVSADDVRSLVVAHTNARGETDSEAVMAGMESLSAPKVAAPAPKVRLTASEAAASSGPLKMKLKPVLDGGCVGTINIDGDLIASLATKKVDPPKLMIIIDRSGSMGQSFSKLLTKVLPRITEKLKMPTHQKTTIVAFDHTIQVHHLNRKEMRESRLVSGGRTFMAPAVRTIGQEIMRDPEHNFRLLVLTDGALHDQDETCTEAGKLAAELRGRVRINTQAVRFYTSSSEPDTRGVCSCLALNTVSDSQLIDLSAAQDEDVLIDAMADAFEGDGLDMAVELEADGEIMTNNPWERTPSKSVGLKPGLNYVWFKKAPKDLRIKGADTIPIDFEISENAVSLEDMSSTLKPLMDSYVTRLKMLKVVNTPSTIEEMKAILEYFERFENFIQQGAVNVTDLAKDHSIAARIQYFRQMAAKRQNSLFGLMSQVANDEKVAKLSAAQQADYLRQVEGKNKNAKALARRAIGGGLDFAGTLHAEIRAMKQHIAEIDKIDDSEHAVSFYSLESTLSGIKALCSFDDETLETMEATDLLQIANIVGIPCSGPIGNFADPMSYRVDKILPGTFLSLSDVLVAHVQSKGKALTAPGFPDVDVTNVIPVYDDPRIQHFLNKYAPSLLSYTASIGMRRIIADVPQTYAYTLVAGAWQMIEVLSKNPTEGNVTIFTRFALDFHQAIHGHFNYVVLDHMAITTPDPGNVSFYIANNGITNMIDPIMEVTNPQLLPGKDQEKKNQIAKDAMNNMSKILRAIYSFEVYQVVRRIFKKEDDQEPFIQQQLHTLLGIDLDRNATPLKPLFEAEPSHEDVAKLHYNEYTLNTERFNEIIKGMWYVDYLALLPTALAAVTKESPFEYIKENFRPKSASIVCQALDLELIENDAEKTLFLFKAANIIQNFISHQKADRVDVDNKKMKIVDLGSSVQTQKDFMKAYVQTQFANRYRTDAVTKLKQEKKQIITELIRTLIHTTSMKEFCQMLQNGLTKAHVSDCISSSSHLGFLPLRNALQDLSHEVPLRLRKLAILVLGHDEDDKPIFNGGNVLFKGLPDIEETFLNLGENNQLEQLRLRYKTFSKHNYRDGEGGTNRMPNRHTHCTDKPSYFALGYTSFEEFAQQVSEKELKQYCKLHYSCCGVPQMQGKITRRSQRASLESQPPADATFPLGDPRNKNNKNDDDDDN